MPLTTTQSIDLTQFKMLAFDIGHKCVIAGWPSNDLSGLVQALRQWVLDPRMSMHGEDPDHPHAEYSNYFRGLCWGTCVREPVKGDPFRTRYVGTKPIHPKHPNAVRYCGGFLGYSYSFWLDTDDPAMISFLDGLIADNMKRPEYKAAALKQRPAY